MVDNRTTIRGGTDWTAKAREEGWTENDVRCRIHVKGDGCAGLGAMSRRIRPRPVWHNQAKRAAWLRTEECRTAVTIGGLGGKSGRAGCDIREDLRHEVGVGFILEECFVGVAGVGLALHRVLDDGKESSMEELKRVVEVDAELVATSYK